jgi:3-oxoacyl-[acyl-carrier protein] reductase
VNATTELGLVGGAEDGLSLRGRVVVITGASAGLGAAYAHAVSEAGASVVLTARGRDGLEQVAAGVARAHAVTGDVADPAFAQRAVDEALSAFGRVDVLVNNAGVVRDRTLLKMTPAEFDEVIQTSVYGSFHMAQACARAMRDAGGGTIINVGSDSGFTGPFGQSNYAAAKGAVLGLTLTWARELPRYRITCNCVLPNALTAMTEGLGEVLAQYRFGPPEAFPRALGEAAESAPLVALLASPRWSSLNGLLLSLGGDKLSIWQPPQETRIAFAQGGWSVAELDRCIEFVLGALPRAGAAADIAASTTGRDKAKEPHGTAHP